MLHELTSAATVLAWTCATAGLELPPLWVTALNWGVLLVSLVLLAICRRWYRAARSFGRYSVLIEAEKKAAQKLEEEKRVKTVLQQQIEFETNSLKEKIAAKKQEEEALRSRQRTLESEKRDMAAQEAALEQSRRQLAAARNSLEKEKAALDQSFRTQKEDLDRLAGEEKGLRQQVREKEAQQARLESALGNLTRQITENQAREKDLADRRDQCQKRIQALSKDLAETQAEERELKALEQRAPALERQVAEMRQQQETLEQNKAELETKAAEARSQIPAAETDLARLKDLLASLAAMKARTSDFLRPRLISPETDLDHSVCPFCWEKFPAERELYLPRRQDGLLENLFRRGVPEPQSESDKTALALAEGGQGGHLLRQSDVDLYLAAQHEWFLLNHDGWGLLTQHEKRKRVFEPRCYKEDCARADYGGFREALRLGRGLRIAVVGTRGTGKTVYLLALMHELHSGALGPYGASTMMTPHIPAGETWSNRMRILFDRRVLPASTQVVGVPGDLIMDVTGVRDGREKGRLFFRDLAGEEWVRLNAVGPGAEFARIGGFISDADVLFFLLNPLAIEEIGSGLGLGQGEESGAHADILRGATGIFRGRGRIPHLCVILTRADELRDWRQLRPHKDFVFDQNWNHRSPVVEFADMVRCQSDGLRKRLSACPSLREFIGLTENYPTCTYFVVSALGQSTYKAKDKEETMIHDRPRPWRVVDPLVYSSLVLTRTGLLEPTRYDGGEGESGNGVMGDGPPVEKAQEPIVPAALPRREKWQKRRRKR